MADGDPRRFADDDSLLASVAGVPLTRMARAAVCLIWGGFWSARILLTDALPHFQGLQLKSALSEMLGADAVDQAFSICMIWLSIEVAVVIWGTLRMGVTMLIAKTPRPFWDELLRRLPREALKAELERREKADADKASEANGHKG